MKKRIRTVGTGLKEFDYPINHANTLPVCWWREEDCKELERRMGEMVTKLAARYPVGGRVGGVSAVAPKPKEATQVEKVLQSMELAVEAEESIITRLEDRLKSISREVTSGQQGSTSPAEEVVPLAGRLSRLLDRMDANKQRLNDLLGSIEL